MSFKVIQPGVLSLLQDSGRYGQHAIGLTTGGPLDREAFYWANRLCGNPLTATALEVSVGGLVLEAQQKTVVAITGANVPVKIAGKTVATWQTHAVQAGERVELGFATKGYRAYLAVAGGFQIAEQFGSTATVVREKIGGLSGSPLKNGDVLPFEKNGSCLQQSLNPGQQPQYPGSAELRVILGYQQAHFPALQQALFFSSEFSVSANHDRMGYRLEGPAIRANIQGILSEGICLGAIQIPADGQPIILLHDRQTIGGYPKLGSVFSLDLNKLTQLTPGGLVRFSPFSAAEAHNTLHLAWQRFQNMQPDSNGERL